MEIVIGILIVIVAICFYNLHQQSLAKDLLEKVSWCVVDGTASPRHPPALIDHLSLYLNKSSNNTTASTYNLHFDSESDMIYLILKAYQENLSKKYFEGALITNRKLRLLSTEEYFMLTLYVFLSNHDHSLTFCDHQMYLPLTHKDSIVGDITLHGTVYELTTFGFVYNKLYFLVLSYCGNNKNLKPFSSYISSSVIKERLDSGEIIFY